MYTKYTGIILKKHPLSEADELLTIYTRESGKLRVKAPGTRKIKSRLAGNLQSLNEIEFETALSTGAGRLPVLISVRVVTLNNFLREDLKKFAYALVGAETLYRLSPDGQENPGVYEDLCRLMKNLDTSGDVRTGVRLFQLRVLKSLGFGFDAEDFSMNEEDRKELLMLWDGEASKVISRRAEQAIEHILHNVLERDIKSSGFVETLNQEKI